MAVAANDDKALVRRMLTGDERAFEDFFARYFPGLYRFALVRVGDDADAAEQIAQATLSAAVAKLATYRGEAALFSWLCTFCRHEIHGHFARRSRRSAIELDEDAPEVRAALDSLGTGMLDDPQERERRGDIARLVRVVLDALPGHYGDALEWKYLDELPVAEIAVRLRVSTKAAESLLTRARLAFRDGFAAVCSGSAELGMDGRGR